MAFYKGIVPPLVAVIPQKAVKFGAYTYFRKMLEGTPLGGSGKGVMGQVIPTMVAGVLAGPLEALFLAPFEVVKINLQSQRSTIPGQQPLYSGTWSAAKTIAKINGLPALYSGLVPTMLRHSFFNIGFFASYELIKSNLPGIFAEHKTMWLNHMVAGFGAGVIATTLANPFDVIKTRIQQQTSLVLFEDTKYNHFLQTFSAILKDEGLAGFYQGYLPRVIRLGTGGAIVFSAYETTLKYLNSL